MRLTVQVGAERLRLETGAGVLGPPRAPTLPVDRAVLARILHLLHLYVYILLNTLRLEEVASLPATRRGSEPRPSLEAVASLGRASR